MKDELNFNYEKCDQLLPIFSTIGTNGNMSLDGFETFFKIRNMIISSFVIRKDFKLIDIDSDGIINFRQFLIGEFLIKTNNY